MKGKFIIVNLKNMDFFKNEVGRVVYYDSLKDASFECSLYELKNVWVLELKYNHIES